MKNKMKYLLFRNIFKYRIVSLHHTFKEQRNLHVGKTSDQLNYFINTLSEVENLAERS